MYMTMSIGIWMVLAADSNPQSVPNMQQCLERKVSRQFCDMVLHHPLW